MKGVNHTLLFIPCILHNVKEAKVPAKEDFVLCGAIVSMENASDCEKPGLEGCTQEVYIDQL